MNGALPEMPQTLAGNCTDMTVLERQRARFHQEDQFFLEVPRQQCYVGDEFGMLLSQGYDGNFEVKPDPGWPELGGFGIGPGFGEKQRRNSVFVGERFRKRKVEKNHSLEAIEEDYKDKKMKACSEEGDSKITEQNSNNESKKTNNNKKKDNSAVDSKVSEVQKSDYIHVRARRGQATDSHSLAERVRREKISERMKYLQDLVPGCNKITGKAGMLDEIINYVQSLQKQVEFLSMKLATVNPTLDFNIDNLFAKEVFSACTPNYPMEIANPAFLQFNPLEQLVSCSGLEMGLNTSDLSIRRTISAPVSIQDSFLDPSTIFNQIQSSSNWDANLQSLDYGMDFVQGRSTSFSPNQFAGPSDASNLKMEMM